MKRYEILRADTIDELVMLLNRYVEEELISVIFVDKVKKLIPRQTYYGTKMIETSEYVAIIEKEVKE